MTNRALCFLIVLCVFVPASLGASRPAAFHGTVSKVKAPDTLVLKSGKIIKLAGVRAPKSKKKAKAVTAKLAKMVVPKRVEVRPDSILDFQAKERAKAEAKTKTKAKKRKKRRKGRREKKAPLPIPAYVHFQCDTCAYRGAPPEFKGTIVVATHSLVHLNRLLIEKQYCKADTAGNYEKKVYFLFLESQQGQKLDP